ncbi:DUF1929-domain-containing protein [Dendrothele bispora CBS 962.96]|uniref:DUF1929-domain-containing protein n=1 Tax=Dendrothele bispora (strain CBS 962.96) TaxID=1314807 RepID=A0A4S8KT31_DENBC|nr:DUF1929-domain-containing protein [Dendrothele bispora CBS 962.96]
MLFLYSQSVKRRNQRMGKFDLEAVTAGSILEVGDTRVSAMMMFVGNNEKVYIIDKAEGNAEQIKLGVPFGTLHRISRHLWTSKPMFFCASGMHLPNGSYVTFGGNGAVTVGGEKGSDLNPGGISIRVLWDPDTNTETLLPDMPDGIVRVYPASAWGNYSWPFINTWEKPASSSCHRITPEPEDGSSPTYTQDDSTLESRTMGQFIILPTGKLLVVNGGLNGTAGYANQTLLTESFSDMPFGMSLASGPVGTPAEYDPKAVSGSRWSNQGFSSTQIVRLYHSSAILLPDASVMIAGSNPSVDVNLTTWYSQNGGSSFDITVPSSSYSGSANNAAENTHVSVVRPGWTTHAMNMGQRYLQLNNTYTVNSDGSLILHVSQMPPIPNIFQPGPAMVFVVVNGIPSNGTFVIVGSGNIETQPTADLQELPQKVQADSSVSGSADGSTTGTGNKTGTGTGTGSSEDPNAGVTIPASRFGILVAVGVLLGFSFGHS